MTVAETAFSLATYIASWWKWFIVILVAAAAFVYLRHRSGLNYFRIDRALGLSSNTFNLDNNIEDGDERSGLDLRAKLRIRWLMFRHGLSFDDARTVDVQNTFALNDVNPDGTPRDPKAFFFL